MKIKRIIVGELAENCYVLEKENSCLIVDPGAEFDKIKSEIGDKLVLGVLLTHHHFDHVGALEKALAYYSTQVYDFNNLQEREYQLGPFEFEVVYNPGHSKDSISFLFLEERVMFVGDFVFLENFGRCDLEGGDIIEMHKSIE